MNGKKSLSTLIALFMLLGSSLAFGADDAKKNESKWGTIKGKIYLGLQFEDLGTAVNANDMFFLDRAYFTYKKKIGAGFSMRITTDIIGNDTSGGDTPYSLYIKYGYLQWEKGLGPVKIKSQLGMVGTPILGLADKLGGMRWVTKNYFDNAKKITRAMDNSADLGWNLSLNFLKMVTLSGAVTAGEGYKDIAAGETDNSKAIYGMATVNPIKELYISGFIRTNGHAGLNENDMYVGGGIAWKTKLFKAGANYAYVMTDNSTYKDHVVDVWVNFNLKSVISIPILVMGRFALGMDTVAASTSTNILAGIGYRFNNNVQTMLLYKATDTFSDANSAKHNIYLKVEAKF
jgi:hypothetical protein